MKSFLVMWEIEIDAETVDEAAVKAWEAMREHGSTANSFVVVDESGDQESVDLQERWEEEALPAELGERLQRALAGPPSTE